MIDLLVVWWSFTSPMHLKTSYTEQWETCPTPFFTLLSGVHGQSTTVRHSHGYKTSQSVIVKSIRRGVKAVLCPCNPRAHSTVSLMKWGVWVRSLSYSTVLSRGFWRRQHLPPTPNITKKVGCSLLSPTPNITKKISCSLQHLTSPRKSVAPSNT